MLDKPDRREVVVKVDYVGKVIPAMEKLRTYVDEMEALTASEFWPLPSYGDMMFNI